MSLFGVTEDQPFGDDNITFRLEGKIFMCLSLGGDEHEIRDSVPRLALKLSPERNEELRAQFSAVTPAFHWNKKHWSDVYYEQLDNTQIEEWIKESYLSTCSIQTPQGYPTKIYMNKVRITAIRQTVYPDLMAKYENPIEHTCDVREGQQWISENGECPVGMCPSAWSSMREFVESLARGEGNFYDGWMKNPMSAMISCNDGFGLSSRL